MEPGHLSPEEAALWREADRILDELLELPAGERLAALDASGCAEPVRARVRRLLREEGAAADRLEKARVLLTPAPAGVAPDFAGRAIGRWVLEGVIGTGGMSVVHAAHDAEHPQRRVAIKLLAGAAVGAIAAERLQREQRALSRLNHPHIVPLIEAGFLADGTPWLAMGLVEGARIDQWCFERGLDVAARVRLMVDVADAVAHAHRALIVHRDLKPGNVLVDGDGKVRLLDFGIAGLIDPGAERTTTLMHALTPEYAAPEQFEGAPPDTAMDVYGLGALLHRLLTGQPPGRRGSADTRTATPSLSIVESAYAGPALLDRARDALRGDLDAVLLKALEREPSQRYAGAGEFAADLRAWLEARPVTAQRPTLRYRVAKFVRRHRGAVGISVAALLSVFAALGVALWQAGRAAEAAALAEARAAEAARESARAGAVSAFLVDLFGAAGGGTPATELPTTADLLAVAEQRIRGGLDDDPRTAARLLLAMGQVNLSLGRLDAARVLLADARDRLARAADADPQDQARIEVALARTDLRAGRFDGALATLAAARRHVDGLATIDPTLREHFVDVEVSALNGSGRAAEAVRVAEVHHAAVRAESGPEPLHVAGAAFNLGIARAAAGDDDGALAALLDAEQAAQGLAGQWELQLSIGNSLASALSAAGRGNEALARRERVLAQTREAYPADHPRLAQTLNNLGSDFTRVGRAPEALALIDEALPILVRRLGDRHPTVASAHNNRGSALAALDRHAEALEAYAQAAERIAPLATPTDRRRLSVLLNEAVSLARLDRATDALARIAQIDAAGAGVPPALRARADLAAAEAALRQGDAARAAAAAEAAVAAAATLHPDGSGLRALALITLADARSRGADPALAEPSIAAASAEIALLAGEVDTNALRAIRERDRLLRDLGATDAAAQALRDDRARLARLLGADDARVRAIDAFALEQDVAID